LYLSAIYRNFPAVPEAMIQIIVILAFSALAMPSFAASPVTNDLARSEMRVLRQDSRLSGREIAVSRRSMPKADLPPKIDWDFSVGAAYTDAEDGSKTWATPFLLKASFNGRKTAVKLFGDGYSDTNSSTGNTSGANDVTAALSHALIQDEASRWVGEIGLTIPAGGEVGSSAARQRLGATYLRAFSESWDALASARLTRVNGDQPIGASRIGQSGVLQATYNFVDAPGTDLVFQLARSYRSGIGGASQLAATVDFPITARKDKGPIGSITFTHGITSGARDNSIELDISFSF
jgi:hypothetical protein